LILADLYRAEIVDVSHDGITLEVTGDWDKVSALIELLRPIGIREIVRTGTVAIARLTEGALGASDRAFSGQQEVR
jgi:acetolactate synthase-1/3 small subunit